MPQTPVEIVQALLQGSKDPAVVHALVTPDAIYMSLNTVARVSDQADDWPLLQYFRMRGAKILELRPFHWDTAATQPALNR